MMQSSWQRLRSLLRSTTRAVPIVAVSVLTIRSLSACSDDLLSPAERDLTDVGPQAAAVLQHRPFLVSQAWGPGDNDFTNPCIAQIPNPAAPGTFIDVAFPGVTHGRGTATHLGRHTVDIYTTHCSWDAEAGAIDARGPWHVVTASGDEVWGTYAVLGTLGPAGADFVGGFVIQGGTGRFENASGEASMHTHDEPDGSGWDWGEGWIAY